jgi:hypothetical protein
LSDKFTSDNLTCVTNVGSFNLDQYLPQDVQTDEATAAGYYSTFKSATQGISFGKDSQGFPNIQLSPQAQQYALDSMALAAQVVPVAGQAFGVFLVLLQVLPQAGAGPGVCSTSPPPGPSLDQLRAWPNFTSWQSTNGGYGPDVPGTFEAYANPLLEYNWLLGANCFSGNQTPSPMLLAQLLAAWNANHEGPARTISRTGLNPAGWNTPPLFDPIAEALQNTWIGQNLPPNANSSFENAINALQNTPHDVTMNMTVNGGPEIISTPKRTIVPLTLHFTPSSFATTAAPPPSPVKKAAQVVGVAAGTAGLTAILYSLAVGKAWDWAFGQAWSAGKSVLSEAREGISSFAGEYAGRSGASEVGSRVQTLLFSRDRYSSSSARAWARSHGYKSGKVDVTANNIRIRQESPGKFRRLRTITFGHGIKAVVGPPK